MNTKDNITADIAQQVTNLNTLCTFRLDPVEITTRATAETFGRKSLARAGKIAYLDNGAELYETFKTSRAHGPDSSKGSPSYLLSIHKGAIAGSIRDIERLIVVGGGSYDSFINQEGVIIKEIFAQNPNAPLNEIVHINVSQESLSQELQAIAKISADIGKPLKTLSIQADFANATGITFDNIMAEWKSTSRAETKAAVIMTGGTFGNLEGITSTEAFPIHDVDLQMANIGELVGPGSTILFDHFTKVDAAESYYNSPELSAFMTNIPAIMQKYCHGLSNFRINDESRYQDPYFSYRAKSIPHARLVAHQLVAETPQEAKIKNGSEKILTIDDKYTVMVSLYPMVDDILRRPAANTGLRSDFHVSSGDLVMHVYKKVGEPAVLNDEGNVSINEKLPQKHMVMAGSPAAYQAIPVSKSTNNAFVFAPSS